MHHVRATLQHMVGGGEQQLRGMPYMRQQAEQRTSALTLGAGTELEWFVLNDVVMGGRSESTCERTEAGGLLFSGTVSTVGGGFCSCRTHESALGAAVGGSTALRLEFTCDESLYKVTLSCGSMSARDVSWQHELPQLGAGHHTVTLPLAHFSGSIHGQPVPGAELDTAALSSIGLNSSIFDMQGQAIPGREGGPFSFTLHALEWV